MPLRVPEAWGLPHHGSSATTDGCVSSTDMATTLSRNGAIENLNCGLNLEGTRCVDVVKRREDSLDGKLVLVAPSVDF